MDQKIQEYKNNKKTKQRAKPQRRSRRLQKLDAEVYFASSAKGEVPGLTLEDADGIPSAMVSLLRGSPPLKVPKWMLEIFENDEGSEIKEVDDDL